MDSPTLGNGGSGPNPTATARGCPRTFAVRALADDVMHAHCGQARSLRRGDGIARPSADRACTPLTGSLDRPGRLQSACPAFLREAVCTRPGLGDRAGLDGEHGAVRHSALPVVIAVPSDGAGCLSLRVSRIPIAPGTTSGVSGGCEWGLDFLCCLPIGEWSLTVPPPGSAHHSASRTSQHRYTHDVQINVSSSAESRAPVEQNGTTQSRTGCRRPAPLSLRH